MFLNLINKRFFIIGLAASLLLLILYFGVLSLAESFSHAISQFSQIWYWILVLAVGFGLQVGLYFYIRASFRLKQMASPTTAVATSGGISTGSMIVCCLHHLVDVLPLMGLAAAAVFLTQYQLWFIFLGILSNFIGIIIMLEIIQKHNLSEGFLKRALVYDMSKVKKIAIGSSLALLLITFFLVNNEDKTNVINNIDLLSKTDSQNGISFKVTPIDFNLDNQVKFEISIDTHSGSLNFNLTEAAILEDDMGNRYQPLSWQGSPPGGHHRSGILIFPELNNKKLQKIKLVIEDLKPRIFEWELQ